MPRASASGGCSRGVLNVPNIPRSAYGGYPPSKGDWVLEFKVRTPDSLHLFRISNLAVSRVPEKIPLSKGDDADRVGIRGMFAGCLECPEHPPIHLRWISPFEGGLGAGSVGARIPTYYFSVNNLAKIFSGILITVPWRIPSGYSSSSDLSVQVRKSGETSKPYLCWVYLSKYKCQRSLI